MGTNSIYVFAKWQVKEGYLKAVQELLAAAAIKSREEEGNLFYKIHQSISDVNMIVLFEGYIDESALNAHRNSVHFQDIVVRQIIPLLENREVIVTTSI